MSISQLDTPSHLSYTDMQTQIRELARRMNLLTMMEAKSVEPTAAPKFTFSEELATLDVPSVADVAIKLDELKEDYEESIEECEADEADCTECEDALAAAEEENAALEEEIDILEEVAGPAYFQRSVTGTWNIGGGCNDATNTSNTSISWISGTSGTTTWLRTEIHSVTGTEFPSICINGGINFTFYTQPDGSGSGNGIAGDRNERGTKTVILNSGTTYYVYARAVNFNDTGVDEAAPGVFQGAFTMGAGGPVMI